MAIDYEARLAKVSAAIEAILEGAQDVSYDGRRVAYADLKVLQDEEKRLEARISRQERGGGIRMRGGVPS